MEKFMQGNRTNKWIIHTKSQLILSLVKLVIKRRGEGREYSRDLGYSR